MDTRFDEGLRGRLAGNLAAFDRRSVDAADLAPAAVALAVVPDGGDDAAFVLVYRGSAGSHQGQFGLPGGRVDDGESDVQAALRELEEEVGVTADPDHVLGRLDDYATRSGFRMTPVVVWCPGAQPRVASPAEIRRVLTPRLSALARPDAPMFTTVPRSGRRSVQMDVGVTTVFAPTGAILYQFREVALLGRATRVADLDQPYFAWS